MITPKKPKIAVILGPTASGKSDLAVKIARKFKGEVVSADSRQVYRGMDIGTGKVPRDNLRKSDFLNFLNIMEVGLPYIYKGVQHHLLDVASPKSTFTVSRYQKLGKKAIKEILARKKLPIICGGTGFYIDALVYDYKLPEVPPNLKLREKLEKKSAAMLFKQLQKLDPARAKNIDRFNKRRLIRALEIILSTKKPVPPDALMHKSAYDVLFIGIKKNQEELDKLIAKRLKKRLKADMVKEIQKLHRPFDSAQGKAGVSWKKLESFGLEYRRIAEYLQNKINYDGMVSLLQKDIEHYAKRQMTWFKRNPKIHWVKNYGEAKKLTDNFL